MAEEDKTVITEKTLIPISLVGMAIIVVIYVVTIGIKASANSDEIEKLQNEKTEILRELKTHGEALVRIETKLENIQNK